MNKQLQKIKADISKGHYFLKKVSEEERDISKKKKVKKLMKKVQKIKEEFIADRMLCFLKLGKKLGEEYT